MSSKLGLVGRKIGMTQVFYEGNSIGCTVLKMGPCVVVGQRTSEKHGYSALQLGFERQAVRAISRPEAGLAKKMSLDVPKVIRELRMSDEAVANHPPGKVLTAKDVFKAGDVVDAMGVSKGKGYQGVIKRHRMRGKPAAHGTHEFFRHGGSIGCRLTPGKVHKGKRMTGHMGSENSTASNLVIVKVLEDDDAVLVKGAVPGGRNGLVLLQGSVKNVKKYIVAAPPKELEPKNPMKASKAGKKTSDK